MPHRLPTACLLLLLALLPLAALPGCGGGSTSTPHGSPDASDDALDDTAADTTVDEDTGPDDTSPDAPADAMLDATPDVRDDGGDAASDVDAAPDADVLAGPLVWGPTASVMAVVLDDHRASLTWSAYGGRNAEGYRVYLDADLVAEVPLTSTTVALESLVAATGYTVRVEVVRGAEESDDGPRGAFTTLAAMPDDALNPSPIDPTVPTRFDTSIDFLTEGDDAPQQGVEDGVLDPARVSVVVGRVVDRAGQGIPGVAIHAVSQPGVGRVNSRRDGRFELVLNGGDLARVAMAREGFLPVERAISVPRRDYVTLDDVVMTSPDPVMTRVVLADLDEIVAAQGSMVRDADGQRQATVLFEPGNRAMMVMPNGDRSPLPVLSFRATEYTVGETGEAAMPAHLPPSSAYTYAVELGVDEAVAAGAQGVEFEAPVPFYVTNFTGFPAGTRAPVGRYDAGLGAWIAEPDGVVLDIVAEVGGEVTVDLDGDGAAESAEALDAIGLDGAEREKLAELYGAGDSLWRVEVAHFSPWDVNWPFGLGLFSLPPWLKKLQEWIDKYCKGKGSIIGCENQTLGETIAIAGTPYKLVYDSGRAEGRSAERRQRMLLTDDAPPADLKAVHLKVEIAGQRHDMDFGVEPNQEYVFEWDGIDVFGRPLVGERTIRWRVDYVYDAVYYESESELNASFGSVGDAPISGSRARGEITLSQDFEGRLGGVDGRMFGLGGWSLDAHHVYEPNVRVLYRGDGGRVGAEDRARVIRRLAGIRDASEFIPGIQGEGVEDDGPATGRALFGARGLARGADGALYIGQATRVQRLQSGRLETVIGGVAIRSCALDAVDDCVWEGPVGEVNVFDFRRIAFDSRGRMLFLDEISGMVRRVEEDGMVVRVAGNGAPFQCVFGNISCDLEPGMLARDAHFGGMTAFALGLDDTLYVADDDTSRVYAVGPDGVLRVFAGSGFGGYGGDGGPAIRADLNGPSALAVGRDGSVYIADSDNRRVRRVTPDGIIRTVVGDGEACDIQQVPGCEIGDGRLATQAHLNSSLKALAVDADGRIAIADVKRLRLVGVDGRIHTLAGDGTDTVTGDRGPAVEATVGDIEGLMFDDNGVILLAGENVVREIAPVMPAFALDGYVIGDTSGEQFFGFDASGRQLGTWDLASGEPVLTHRYDEAGWLVGLVDAYGNETRIERDGAGVATAIVGVGGERTTLEVVDGDLVGVTDPMGGQIALAYDRGLLTSAVNARGLQSTFTYDGEGRLTADENPAGGVQTLTRRALSNGFEVERGWGPLSEVHRFEELGASETRHTIVATDGATVTQLATSGGLLRTITPDGSEIRSTQLGHPVFGLQSPRTVATVKTPAEHTLTRAGWVTLERADDGADIEAMELTESVAQRIWRRRYDRATSTWTMTTPTGRTARQVVNAAGEAVRVELGDQVFSRVLDDVGRVTSVDRNGREWRFGYDGAQSAPSRVTTPEGEVMTYTLDALGRVSGESLPDGGVTTWERDGVGNLVRMERSGGAVTTMTYNGLNQLSGYTLPSVDGAPSSWTLDYDAFGRPLALSSPEGESATFIYDTLGRLERATVGGAASSETSSTWTAAGYPQAFTEADGDSLEFTYDGNLIVESTARGAFTATVARDYDSARRVSARRINGAHEVTFAYDNDGLLIGAGGLDLVRAAPTGRIDRLVVGQLTETRSYAADGMLDGVEVRHQGTLLFSQGWTRDAVGRIAVMDEFDGASATWTWGYSPTGRLDSASRDDGASSVYTWDQRGNRTSIAGTLEASLDVTFDAQDRPTGSAGASGATSYDHVSFGRLSQSDAAGTRFLEYDVLGHLHAVELADGRRVRYDLDPLGRRVRRQVQGAPVRGWIYAGGEAPIAEVDGTGTVISRFVYGTWAHVPDLMIRGGVTWRIVTDHRGSVRMVVNAQTGAVDQRLSYSPFGEVWSDSAPGFQPFGFGGGMADELTGLVHFGARDYDPRTATWTSPDPSFLDGGPNLYAYAAGDPVNGIDPAGRFAFLAAAAPYLVAGAVGFGLDVGAQYLLSDHIDLCSAVINGLAGAAGVGIASKLSKLNKLPFIGRALPGWAKGGLSAVANGGVSGVGQGTLNYIEGKPIGEGVLTSVILGGVADGVSNSIGTSGAGVGSGRGVSNLARGAANKIAGLGGGSLANNTVNSWSGE